MNKGLETFINPVERKGMCDQRSRLDSSIPHEGSDFTQASVPLGPASRDRDFPLSHLEGIDLHRITVNTDERDPAVLPCKLDRIRQSRRGPGTFKDNVCPDSPGQFEDALDDIFLFNVNGDIRSKFLCQGETFISCSGNDHLSSS